jgi:predicted MFS family arabinose efflux permease
LSGWAVAATFIGALVLTAIALDASAQGSQILAQRVIYGIDPEARGRINAVFMTSIFVAGAIGSLLAGVTFFYGGWPATAATGGAFGLLLVVLFVMEPKAPVKAV